MDKIKLLTFLYLDGSTRKRFYRKLATLSRNNISLVRSIERMRDRAEDNNSHAAQLYGAIVKSLHDGQSLDVALIGVVPPEECMLLKGGVDSGNLEDSLDLAAGLIDAKQSIVSSIVSALSYPAMLVFIFSVMLVVIAAYVVPRLTAISNPANWQGGARVLYSVSAFIASPAGFTVAGILVLLAVLAVTTLPYWTGPLRRKLDGIPPWSSYRLVTGCVWLFTCATLMRADIQFSRILDDMLDSGILRPWLAERVAAIKGQYVLGKDLGQALLDSGYHFPDDELIDDFCVYSALPQFESKIHELAKDWLKEGIEKIITSCKVLNVACITGIVIMMCGVALAISSLQQQLTHGMGGF